MYLMNVFSRTYLRSWFCEMWSKHNIYITCTCKCCINKIRNRLHRTNRRLLHRLRRRIREEAACTCRVPENNMYMYIIYSTRTWTSQHRAFYNTRRYFVDNLKDSPLSAWQCAESNRRRLRDNTVEVRMEWSKPVLTSSLDAGRLALPAHVTPRRRQADCRWRQRRPTVASCRPTSPDLALAAAACL